MGVSEPGQSRGFDDLAGWTTLERFLSRSEIREIVTTCDALLQLPANQRRARDRVAAGTHHLCELDDRSELVDAILNRQSLVSVVAQILGPVFHRDEVEYRCPQPSFGSQMLHADDMPKVDNGPATVATAIVALTDFTADNCATRLVPGSHRRPDLQRKSGSLADHPEQIMLTGPAGTAFVFSGHVLHSGTKNRSRAQRPALHVVWRL